jgi:hypothetical protein
MTKTLGTGQIPPSLLRPAYVAGPGSRTLGVGRAAPRYLLNAVDQNVIPAQAGFEFVTAAGVFSTRPAPSLYMAFERRRCNFGLNKPMHRLQ